MPEPSFDGECISSDYAIEINYDPVELAETLQTDVSRLNEEQRLIFDHVCCSVNSALGEMLSVDAPGKTGKTFLTKRYFGEDTKSKVMEEEESTSYPVEFLESVGARGLSAYKINLKVNVPIMLLSNLKPSKFCNGTRIKVTNL
ncbi:unnamed protein product [Euphydryas editha]|uniref:DNA helicase Pif1-like 2B domain-containing protein n=1 Tax=Euphydryas editha TaxID=104508 RepID=A0AAU9U2Y7_EUPED|nr:unnamed protein product [Euphydryas editha]